MLIRGNYSQRKSEGRATVTTNSGIEQANPAAWGQRLLQARITQFGWQPGRAMASLQQEILAASPEDDSLKTVEQTVMRCYCAHWYAACRSGEPAQQHNAFAALYAYLFQKAIYIAMMRYNVERAYAEQMAADSAQEAIVLVWQKLHQVKEPGSFLGWAKLIVTRVVLHKLQQEGDLDSLDAEEAAELADNRPPVSPMPEAEPEITQAETPDPVEAAIRRCLKKADHQQIIIEHLLHNKTLKQVADRLGRTPGDVRQIKRRALDRLRKCEGMRELMDNQANGKKGQDQQTNPFHLYQAIEGVRDTTLSCATVETWLPRYIDDELAGEDVATKYPDIKRHLDLCPDCEPLYVALLALALAEQTGPAPLPVSAPAPDLSFLPPLPSFVTLARDLVSTVTQHALHVLAPQALPDLAMLSELFFKRTEALGGQLSAQRSAVATLGHEDPTTAVLVALTASYLTTQQIAQTLARQELQQQSQQGALGATLRPIAQRIAEENGMKAADAQTFAQIYADEAQQATDTWFALIERLR